MREFEQDYTRPLLLGYLRRELLVAESEVTEIKQRTSKFAATEGFAMGSTYVEKPDSWPAAFEALVESVNRYEASAVIVPSPLHFVMLGGPSMRSRFEQVTGAQVLALNSP